MSEFVLIFRMDITTRKAQPTAAQMKIYMEQWGVWMQSLEAEDRICSGNHLSREGWTLEAGRPARHVPHVTGNVSIAGYIIVRASGFKQAVKIAQGCPILQGKGTSVEVRAIASPGKN